jgi:hypothetical protein
MNKNNSKSTLLKTKILKSIKSEVNEVNEEDITSSFFIHKTKCNFPSFYKYLFTINDKSNLTEDEEIMFCDKLYDNFQKYKIRDINHEMANLYNFELLYNCLNYIKSEIFNNTFQNISITDTNAGFGGFTYVLLFFFNNINVVDIDSKRIDFIKSNVMLYKKYFNITSNIHFYPTDYLQVYKKLKQDIIISDFPWYGIGYKSKDLTRLSIKNKEDKIIYIEDIVIELYKQNKFKLYLILIPHNFDMKTFDKHLNIHSIPYSIFNEIKSKINENKHRIIIVYNKEYK